MRPASSTPSKSTSRRGTADHTPLVAVRGLGTGHSGPVPSGTRGYRYIYVAVDKFTKWAEVEAVHTIPAGSAVKSIKGLVSRFGVPNRIITDNGLQFTNNLFKTYCANLGTQICYASVAHPRSNGQAE